MIAAQVLTRMKPVRAFTEYWDIQQNKGSHEHITSPKAQLFKGGLSLTRVNG